MKTYRAEVIDLLTRDLIEIVEMDRFYMSASDFRRLCHHLDNASQFATDHFAMMHISCDDSYLFSVMRDEIGDEVRLELFRDIVTEPVVLRRYSLEVPDEG